MRPNPRGLGATDRMCLCFCQSSSAQSAQPQLVFAAGRPVASRRGSQATLGVHAVHTNVHVDKWLWAAWLCRGGGWSDLPPLPIDGINNTKRVILLHFVLVSESIPCPERDAELVCPCPAPPGLLHTFRFSGVNDVSGEQRHRGWSPGTRPQMSCGGPAGGGGGLVGGSGPAGGPAGGSGSAGGGGGSVGGWSPWEVRLPPQNPVSLKKCERGAHIYSSITVI